MKKKGEEKRRKMEKEEEGPKEERVRIGGKNKKTVQKKRSSTERYFTLELPHYISKYSEWILICHPYISICECILCV